MTFADALRSGMDYARQRIHAALDGRLPTSQVAALVDDALAELSGVLDSALATKVVGEPGVELVITETGTPAEELPAPAPKKRTRKKKTPPAA